MCTVPVGVLASMYVATHTHTHTTPVTVCAARCRCARSGVCGAVAARRLPRQLRRMRVRARGGVPLMCSPVSHACVYVCGLLLVVGCLVCWLGGWCGELEGPADCVCVARGTCAWAACAA